MRDAVDEARLEHAQAPPDPDNAVGIGEHDRSDPVVPQAAKAAGEDRRSEKGREGCERFIANVKEKGVLSRASDVSRGQIPGPPGWILGQPQDLPASLTIAEQRQRRRKHRERQEEVFHPGVAGLQLEPEVEPDAAVEPDDEQQHSLQNSVRRRAGPELEELLVIALVGPEQAQRHARADDMGGEQERNGESERELGRLHPRPAELAPFVERPEAEAQVDRQRRIEKNRPGRRLPDQLLQREAPFHRIDGNISQRMIGVMQRDIDEQDEPAGQPDLAKAEPELPPRPDILDVRHEVFFQIGWTRGL